MKRTIYFIIITITVMFPSIQGCKINNELNNDDISNLASTFVKSDSYRKLKVNFRKLETALEEGSIKLNSKNDEYELKREFENIKTEDDLDKVLSKITTNSSFVKAIILEISKTSQEISQKYPNLKKISKTELQAAIKNDLKNDILSQPRTRIMKCDCSDDYARTETECLMSAITDAAGSAFLVGISGATLGVGLIAVVAITSWEVYQYIRCNNSALVTLGICFDDCSK
jgi:hypothetical protein